MNLTLGVNGRLRRAVRAAFLAGIAGSLANSASAQEGVGTTGQSTGDAKQLQGVTVTGSRVRRVDTETASPVFVIDRTFIDQSDAQTVGQLIMELPSIAGNATNPQVNNGGGDGATTVSLRGLGPDRTLLLLDGHRIVTQDVNALPINVVDRLEILKEGASAIYGSDAVGGVVNIITRKNLRTGEFTADIGESKKHDGGRQDYNLAWGIAGTKGNLVVGLNYNKQNEISAGNRNYSKSALYLYSGQVLASGGSSRTPTGRIYLPAGDAAQYGGCKPADGLISVTRGSGTGSSQSDYRCYNSATDGFNFQSQGNNILTPQERYGLFTEGNYKITEDVQIYTEFFHNVTTSDQQIAPLPFDARNDNIVVSAENIYNPFNMDFGGQAVNEDGTQNDNLLNRFSAAGFRTVKRETLTDQLNVGFRGELYGWNWDAGIGYGRIDETDHGLGYISSTKLQEAVGPSFYADPTTGNSVAAGTPGAVPTCGTPDAPSTDGCVPIDIFNLAQTPAALKALQLEYTDTYLTQFKNGAINFNGDLFKLPAGALSLAGGVEYRQYIFSSVIDSLTTSQPPLFLNCGLSSETCSSPTSGQYDSTEYYVETLVPIFKDLPGAKALNVSLGTRYSDYSDFGTTLNSKIGLEWRPVKDLLARGSFSQVFRAPTIADLYTPPASNSPTFKDPCAGITTPVGANPNLDLACQNVPRDGSFVEATSQTTGVVSGNPDLKPERGHVATFGLVYDPSEVAGLSTSVDFWKYSLTDVITPLDVNTTVSTCEATGSASYCSLIHRNPDGTVLFIGQPTTNEGTLKTQGVDFGFKYRIPRTPIGKFRVTFDATYLDKYDSVADPSHPETVTHSAGTYDRQYGEFSRWRGIGTVGWENFGIDALWTVHYIGGFILPNASAGTIMPNPTLHFGASIYDNVEIGYTLAKTQTRVAIGVDNVFDQPPPILYLNNVVNANTDVNTFDTVGTYYWLRFTQKF